MNKNVENFVKTVKEYIGLMDTAEEIPLKTFLAKCSLLLPKIYYQAQLLPDIEPPDSKATDHNNIDYPMEKITSLLNKYNNYSLVFNPIQDNAAIKSSMADDLADTYLDLKHSLINYESKNNFKAQSAIWDWKFDFETHYGKHIVGAISPIYEILFTHLED